MAHEQIYIVPVHGHDEIPEGSFVCDACNPGVLLPDILYVISGRVIQVLSAAILGFHDRLKTAMKIKTM